MSDTITVYEKPTCTKCREMDRFLRESNVDFSKINYYLEPIGEPKLRELIRKMGIAPRDLLRKSESIYRELGLGKEDLSDDEKSNRFLKVHRSFPFVVVRHLSMLYLRHSRQRVPPVPANLAGRPAPITPPDPNRVGTKRSTLTNSRADGD